MSSPGSSRVWLVRSGDPDGVAGTLALSGSTLSFTSTSGEELAISRSEIGAVRRRRGTPILELSVGERPVFFYFVEPPPLPLVGREEGAEVTGRGRRHRRRERARSMISLRAAGSRFRHEIDGWVAAIREAGGQ